MKKLFFAIVVVALPTFAAVAQQAGQQPKQSPKSGTLRPPKDNPCAAYGPGFIQLRGSDTCIKIGGSVEAGGGASR
ncbi:MAG TPA: hypothetical protein VGF02_10550 [Pseudolabrys sp.]|jgi:hypothetical protein